MKKLTWADIEKAATMGHNEGRAPNLRVLAAFINENMPFHTANVGPYSETPYRKIGRLRSDYKTRYGLRLEVYARRDNGAFPAGIVYPIFTHKTTDPYRRNSEVCVWMVENKPFIGIDLAKGADKTVSRKLP